MFAGDWKSTPRIHFPRREWLQKRLSFTKIRTEMDHSFTPRLQIDRKTWLPKRLNFYKCGPVTGFSGDHPMTNGMSPITAMTIRALAFNQSVYVSLGMYWKIKICSTLAMTAVWRPMIWWWAVSITLPY